MRVWIVRGNALVKQLDSNNPYDRHVAPTGVAKVMVDHSAAVKTVTGITSDGARI
jgi:hypothetical protein